jgi:RNA polymerase sigma-70 factor (ECF subfamily)
MPRRFSNARAEEFERTALVHLDSLFAVALRLTRNRAEAEDVVQEACLRAFRHFDRFDPGTNCRAWLLTIMRNVFLNRRRAAGREQPEADLATLDGGDDAGPAHAPPLESPDDRLFRSVLHGDVDRALGTLPLAFREAVVLADLEGLSYREIADVIGCPIGTVMSRLARGRRLLRRALARCGHEYGYTRTTE